jgi:propanol-preferring alcohol dehydrogenase
MPRTSVHGSFVGDRQDLAESLRFAAEGKVKSDTELQPLSDINDVFERLQNGDVAARVALDHTLTDMSGALPQPREHLRKGISL